MKIGSTDISAAYIGSTAINKVYIGSTEVWTSFTGLLDTYPGAAAAYSLRQLRSAYTGYAIKVRRASDNTEQDIGFSNNVLDTTSLASFCSGTNGFVTTWYDQSGNGNNATQTTAANQPKIYDSSTGVITENGKAAVQFDGVNDGLFDSTLSETNSNISIISALTMGTTGQPFGAQDASQGIRTYQGSASNFRWECRGTSFGTLTFQDFSGGGHILKMSIFTPTSQSFYSNGSTVLTATNTSSDYQLRPVQLGARYNASTFFDGKLQEILFYPSNQSSNRTGIETNINDYYAIY